MDWIWLSRSGVLLGAYLIGGIPTAYLATRFLRGDDIRQLGDRNSGAANVFRNVGPKAGLAVGVIDIVKGAVAVILAAGKGTRMGPTDLPKVLYEVAGRPMVHWVIKAAREAGVERCILVIGYQAQMVRDALADEPDCSFVEQTEQLGTAHATSMARDLVADQGPVDPLDS